jgi:hypothetical protein
MGNLFRRRRRSALEVLKHADKLAARAEIPTDPDDSAWLRRLAEGMRAWAHRRIKGKELKAAERLKGKERGGT